MDIINWLLESDSYVQYATRVNLLKQNKNGLIDLKNEVINELRIQKYLQDISDC